MLIQYSQARPLIFTLGEEAGSSGNKKGNKKVEGEEGVWGKSKQKVEKGRAGRGAAEGVCVTVPPQQEEDNESKEKDVCRKGAGTTSAGCPFTSQRCRNISSLGSVPSSNGDGGLEQGNGLGAGTTQTWSLSPWGPLLAVWRGQTRSN